MQIDEEQNPDVTALSPERFVEHCNQLTHSEIRLALTTRTGEEKGGRCIPSVVSFVVHAQEKLDNRLSISQ